MQFPHPFTCQMRGANHDVEGFPSGASVRSAVLVGIQGGGTDLAFAVANILFCFIMNPLFLKITIDTAG